jgi:hypothetical protein
MEELIIRSFAGIENANIKLKPFSIIIGERRNELSKLIHFLIEILLNPANATNFNAIVKLFRSYFPKYKYEMLFDKIRNRSIQKICNLIQLQL